MILFSERYGFVKPSDVIIRESMPIDVQNAICSCFDRLNNTHPDIYKKMERHIWTSFLNKRESDFVRSDYRIYNYTATSMITSKGVDWYFKLDLIEFSVKFLFGANTRDCMSYSVAAVPFVDDLNYEFNRLRYAYRIINMEVVEITSSEEIHSIEVALSSDSQVKRHISKALELYSIRPLGDYRNSIKESISAVEALCRDKTGELTLGRALKKLEDKGVIIPPLLVSAFEKLYAYTNHPDTGIRHALMDVDGKYEPSASEALFMLVSCSSFINYLNKKA